jgi:hypothetical protein
MKKSFGSLFGFFAVFLVFLIPLMLFAQDLVVPVSSNEDFIGLLLQSLGGLKGASSLAIAGIVVQLLMKFVGTPWADKLFANAGPWKLIIVALLSYLSGVVGLMASAGLSFGAAALHSSVLAAFMVFLNQVYKQFIEKKPA